MTWKSKIMPDDAPELAGSLVGSMLQCQRDEGSWFVDVLGPGTLFCGGVVLNGCAESLAVPPDSAPAVPPVSEGVETLIPWLLEQAIKAADSGASDAAGKLEYAAHLLGRLLDDGSIPVPPAPVVGTQEVGVGAEGGAAGGGQRQHQDHHLNTMKSYLSPDDVQAAQSLHKRTPYLIAGVSRSQFSIARHYGGTTYNGEAYTYIHETDELVRDDVLRLLVKLLREQRKVAKAAGQGSLLP
jgi:hypothetical protein